MDRLQWTPSPEKTCPFTFRACRDVVERLGRPGNPDWPTFLPGKPGMIMDGMLISIPIIRQDDDGLRIGMGARIPVRHQCGRATGRSHEQGVLPVELECRCEGGQGADPVNLIDQFMVEIFRQKGIAEAAEQARAWLMSEQHAVMRVDGDQGQFRKQISQEFTSSAE